MRKMLAAIAFLSATHAWAADWQPVFSTPDAATSIDRSTLVRKGNLVEYWAKMDFVRPQIYHDKFYQTLLTDSIANCSSRAIKEQALVFQYRQGQPETRNLAVDFLTIPAHSPAQAVIQYVCANPAGASQSAPVR